MHAPFRVDLELGAQDRIHPERPPHGSEIDGERRRNEHDLVTACSMPIESCARVGAELLPDEQRAVLLARPQHGLVRTSTEEPRERARFRRVAVAPFVA